MKQSPVHKKRNRLPGWVMIACSAIVALVILAWLIMVGGFLLAATTFSVAVAVMGSLFSAMELRWRLYTRRSPEAKTEMQFPEPTTFERCRLAFDLLVPAKNEARVIGATLQGMCASAYHGLTVFAALRAGDTATINAARQVLPDCGGRLQIVTRAYGEHEKKPAQLNAAFAKGTGDIVGIGDAEDEFHPKLISHVAAIFANDSEVGIVQAGVQLVNLDLRTPEGASWFKRLLVKFQGWWCLHNVLEYYFWFSSRMFYQIRQKVVPLGGNTVFIRRSVIEQLGGWNNLLTEDCDLGIRATLAGIKMVAVYDPRLATREETPHSLIGFFKQRRRWDQGFLEVIHKGDWRKLPTLKQRWMARYILGMPFLQGFYGLLLPFSLLTGLWLNSAVILVMLMFVPLVLLFMTLVLQVIGLREFGREFGQKVQPHHYVSLFVGFYLFQVLLAVAAIDSIRRLLMGQDSWDLTEHHNQHRGTEVVSVIEYAEEGGAA